jgi:hypothetical protein
LRAPSGLVLDRTEHGGRLDGPGLTFSLFLSVVLMMPEFGMQQDGRSKGSALFGRFSTRRNLVFGGSGKTSTMMQSYASAASLRAADPFSKAA